MKLPKEAQAVLKKYDEKLCKHLVELVNYDLLQSEPWNETQRLDILRFVEEKGWWWGFKNGTYFLAENKDDRLRRKLREEAQQVGVEN